MRVIQVCQGSGSTLQPLCVSIFVKGIETAASHSAASLAHTTLYVTSLHEMQIDATANPLLPLMNHFSIALAGARCNHSTLTNRSTCVWGAADVWWPQTVTRTWRVPAGDVCKGGRLVSLRKHG